MGSFNFPMSKKDEKCGKTENTEVEEKGMSKETRENENSLREEARKAKLRMKSGFWTECQETMQQQMEKARQQGLNESGILLRGTAGKHTAQHHQRQSEADHLLHIKQPP